MIEYLALVIYVIIFFYIHLNYITFTAMLLIKRKSPQKKEKITAIIASKNEAHTIEKTLISLRRSGADEIILADSSTDDTRKIAKKYARIIDCRNLRKGPAINKAVRYAKNDIIYIIDADTIVEKNTIKKLVAALDKCDVAAGLSRVRNKKNIIEAAGSLQNSIHNMIIRNMKYIVGDSIIRGYNFAIRKKTLLEIGGFQDVLTEDINLSYRLYKKRKKIQVIDDAICTILTPYARKDYMKQQERWIKGGNDEIKKSMKYDTWKEKVFKVPLLSAVSMINTITPIFIILGIALPNTVIFSGGLVGFFAITISYIKYEKPEIRYPVVFAAAALLEIITSLRVIKDELMHRHVKWDKTPK